MNILTSILICISISGLLDLEVTDPLIICVFCVVFGAIKIMNFSFHSLFQWNFITSIFTFLCAVVNCKNWINGQWFDYATLNVIVVIIYAICNVVGLYLFFNLLVQIYFNNVSKIQIKDDNNRIKKSKFLLICFIVIFSSQIISFCTYYPGIITNDSYGQILQALGMMPYSNHHPIAHTFIIKCCMETVYFFTGSMNLTAAGYSVFQMLCLTGAMMYMLDFMYMLKVKRFYRVLALLYFAVIPYHSVYSQIMGKDIPFAISVSVFVISLYKIIQFQKEQLKKIDYLVLFFSGIGFCLLRSNGIIAFLLVLILAFVMLRKNKHLLVLLSSVFICSIVVLGPIYGLFSTGGPDTIESLSIPLQQIGKVICEGEVNDEEYLMLNKIMDVEQVEQTYDVHFSDPLKNLVRSTGDQVYLKQNMGKYLKLYVQLGIKNPRKYVKAFIEQTMGYWYPNVEPYIWNTELRQNTIGMERDSIFPKEVAQVIENIQLKMLNLPILGLFKSIGLQVWLLLLQMFYCFKFGNKKVVLCYVSVLAIMLSLILGSPYWCTLRYSYAMFLSFPVVFIMAFGPINEIENKESGTL